MDDYYSSNNNNKKNWLTCSRWYCRLLKDRDRLLVCPHAHAVNATLPTASIKASTAAQVHTDRSWRICCLSCIIRRIVMLGYTSYPAKCALWFPSFQRTALTFKAINSGVLKVWCAVLDGRSVLIFDLQLFLQLRFISRSTYLQKLILSLKSQQGKVPLHYSLRIFISCFRRRPGFLISMWNYEHGMKQNEKNYSLQAVSQVKSSAPPLVSFSKIAWPAVLCGRQVQWRADPASGTLDWDHHILQGVLPELRSVKKPADPLYFHRAVPGSARPLRIKNKSVA